MMLPQPKAQYDIRHQSEVQRQIETELTRLRASVNDANAAAITQAQADARYVKLDGSAAMTGMLTLASVINALKLPNNARLVSVDTSSDQAGEFILIAGDNGTYVTLAPGGFFNVRASSEVILLHVDESGNLTATGGVTAGAAMKQNDVNVAKVVWSTSAATGTPASGVGTIWVQY